jgi:hypothetical protein
MIKRMVDHARTLMRHVRKDEKDVRYIDAWHLDPYFRQRTDRLAGADKGTQILLSLLYQDRLQRQLPLPDFADVEFRCFRTGKTASCSMSSR